MHESNYSDSVLELRMSIPEHLFTRLLQPVFPLALLPLFILPFAVQDEYCREHERHTKHTNINSVASRVFWPSQVSTTKRSTERSKTDEENLRILGQISKRSNESRHISNHDLHSRRRGSHKVWRNIICQPSHHKW